MEVCEKHIDKYCEVLRNIAKYCEIIEKVKNNGLVKILRKDAQQLGFQLEGSGHLSGHGINESNISMHFTRVKLVTFRSSLVKFKVACIENMQ